MAGLCSNAPGCCAVQEGSTGQTELNAYKKSIEILHNGNKKSLPNVELSSDTWRRRWDSPAPLQQSAGLLQPSGTQSAGHGLFESCIVCYKNKKQHPARYCSWRRRWDSNPRGIAAKLISSFLVYIATDGIYRKKAEVVGR